MINQVNTIYMRDAIERLGFESIYDGKIKYII